VHQDQPPHRVTQHPHGLNCGQGPGGIEPDVLLKEQLLVEIKSKVMPSCLRPERGVPREGLKAQVDRKVRIARLVTQ
jgi:hypothetical protein